jgi:septal ring factor EnvC (AmiA/AmiB activator)
MLFPQLSLFLEVIGATLLAVMIVYAVRLNRRLSSLQDDKAEFERLMLSFTDSTSRAETSVARLKASATDTAYSLQESVTRAQALRDDLAFMVDRADDLANRLDYAIRDARPDQAKRGATAQNVTSGEKVSTEPSKSGLEKSENPSQRKTRSDLLKALEGMR